MIKKHKGEHKTMSEKRMEEKELRIKGIKVKNFKAIDTINVTFDGGHTRIIGLNGHGKTSIIDAVRACFVGISQKSSKGEILGERFRYIGSKGAAAELEVQLEDTQGNFICTVTNHMTAGSNGIDIISADGRRLSKEWARDLFNVIFRSADNFLKLSPKEQALALGIDTDKYDRQIAQIKNIAQQVRRDLKALGEPKQLEKVKPVDTYALNQQLKKEEAHNREQEKVKSDIAHTENCIKERKQEIEALEGKIWQLKQYIKDDEGELKFFNEKLTDLKPTDDIEVKLSTADETNRAAEAYERNEELKEKRKKVTDELAGCQLNIGKIGSQRTDYIKSFKFAVDGLSVDDAGGLLIDGRRLDTYSTAERVALVSKLNSSLDPQLLTDFIDDFQNLDPQHQEQIINDTIEAGRQLITFEVGDASKGKGSILLRDCKVVE